MTETRPADRRCYILCKRPTERIVLPPLLHPKIFDSSSQLLILLQLNFYDIFMREAAEELYLSCKSCVSTNNLIFQNVTFHGKLLLFPSQAAFNKSQKNYKINRFDRNPNRKPHSKSPMDPPIPQVIYTSYNCSKHFSPQSKAFISSALPHFLVLSLSLYQQPHEVICLLKLTTGIFNKPQGHL